MKTNKILIIILTFIFLGFAHAYNNGSLEIKKEIIETSYCKDDEKSCSKESTKKENCSKGKSCCKTTGKAVVDCDKKKQGCCKNSK